MRFITQLINNRGCNCVLLIGLLSSSLLLCYYVAHLTFAPVSRLLAAPRFIFPAFAGILVLVHVTVNVITRTLQNKNLIYIEMYIHLRASMCNLMK